MYELSNYKTFILNNGQFVDISTQTSYTQSGLNNKTIALLNPFRYRSYYYDVETGLYYLNSRYYDPEIGRFINADDISILSEGKDFFNGLNLYAYCGNNPVNDIDNNGDWSWKAFWKILAGIAIIVSISVAVAVTAGIAGAAIGAAAATTLGLSGITSAITTVAVGAFIGGTALVTGLTVGVIEFGNQIATKGAENINLGSVAIMTMSGSLNGTFDALNVIGKTFSKIPGVQGLGYLLRGIAAFGKVITSGLVALAYGKSEGYDDKIIINSILTSMGLSTLMASIMWFMPVPKFSPIFTSPLIQGGIRLFNIIFNK